MSRINRQKNKTVSDGTVNQAVYNRGAARKIHKKVGHKGDYAIVKFNSPFISSNKTGAGTSLDPFTYRLDIEDTLVNSISSNKAKLLEQMEESKSINAQVNSLQNKHLSLLTGLNEMFSFNVDLVNLSLKIKDIGNSTDKNISVSKDLPRGKTIQEKVNNNFIVGGTFTLPHKCSIKHTLKIESKDLIDSSNPIPCESGYKVHVKKEKGGESFSFHITYKGLPLTYQYLKEKIITKMKKISIDFLVEYNSVSDSPKALGTRATGASSVSSGGGGY